MEEVIDLQHGTWSSVLLRTLHMFQNNGLHCDAVLESDDGTSFLVHSCVVAAASATLHEELISQTFIRTPVSSQALKAAIQLMYTGSTDALQCCDIAEFQTANDVYFKLDIPGVVSGSELLAATVMEDMPISEFLSVKTAIDIQSAETTVSAGGELDPVFDIRVDPCFDDVTTVMAEHVTTENTAQQITLDLDPICEEPTVVPKTELIAEDTEVKTEIVTREKPTSVAITHRKRPVRIDAVNVKPKPIIETKKTKVVPNKGSSKTPEGYSCNFCSKLFKRKADATVHLRVHTGEKPFGCAHCDKSFARKGHRNAHERIHTGQRPFQCDTCGKSFKESGHLQKHSQCHTGLREHQCQYCSKTFTARRTLVLHEKSHLGEKDHQCSYCEKRFVRRGDLVIHERYHTGDKPHPCRTCARMFYTHTARLAHERRHAGKKEFTCVTCGKGFATGSNLRSHRLIHDGGIKTHICQYCGKTFRLLHQRLRHELIHERKMASDD